MADKRTTKRERKDEARKRRLEELRRQQRRTQVKKLYTAGISAVVIAGIIVLILATRSGTSAHEKELVALAKEGGCEKIENPAKIAGKHIPPTQKGSYNTDPPSSGEHYASPNGAGPVNTGIYDQEVPNESYVHNLEHGHIAIFYKTDLDPTILEEMKALVRSDPTYILLAPRSGLTTPLVFVAWGHIQRCPTPNAKTVDVAKAFVKEFKDKAPERGLPGTPTGI